jgi:hypothetical protein
MRFVVALLAVAALLVPALAQDKPAAKADKPAKIDRGDAKAEKMLKKGWDRVQSAEAAGLTRLKAVSVISATAMGKPYAFEGNLLWKSGGAAAWVQPESDDGKPNQFGTVADMARKLFEPYLAYAMGFESWDVKFKEASFKMGEAAKDKDGKKTGDTVAVTYADKRVESFTISENKIVAMNKKTMVDDNTAKVEFKYTYEDTGKTLRLNKVSTVTRIMVGGLPPADEPEKKGEEKGKKDKPEGEKKEADKEADEDTVETVIEGFIEIKKYGKAGEYDIAVELAGELTLPMLGKLPTKLTISEPKVNKDVSDEDLKPLEPPAEERPAEEKPAEKAPEKKPDSN